MLEKHFQINFEKSFLRGSDQLKTKISLPNYILKFQIEMFMKKLNALSPLCSDSQSMKVMDAVDKIHMYAVGINV